MNKAEQTVVDAFESSLAVPKSEILEYVESHVTRAQAFQGYTTLLTKGILAEDEYGVVTLSRKRLAEYDELYPLVEAPDEDF